MTMMVMVRLRWNQFASRGHGQGTVFHAPNTPELIGERFKQMAFPLNDQDLKAIMMIQMNM